MKKYIKLLIALCCSLYNAQKIDVKSPQSYEMQRYGNIPVNLNTGGVDVNIPLFQAPIRGVDKDLSLNLSYNSSGFIPTKRSNYVGLGWLLDFGGMITRDINHLPDDEPEFAFEGNKQVSGFLVGIRNTTIAKESIFNNNIDIDDFGNFKSGGSNSFELAPDKFTFNFMGISGYFYIDAEKNPICVSNDPNIKIDLVGLQNQKSPKIGCHYFNNSQIVITDGKGNKYYFGGSEENLEVNYPLGTSRDSPNTSVTGQNYYINTWYLREVNFVNGTYLNISYLKYEDVGSIGVSDGFCQNSFFPPTYRLPGSEVFFEQHSYVNSSTTSFSSVTNDGVFSGVNSSSVNPSLSYHFNLVKKVYPARITVNGHKVVEFSYKQNEGSSFNNPSLGNVFNKYYKSYSLENLYLYNGVNDLLVKKVGFKYSRNNEYFFLDELNINDLKYQFNYYDKNVSLVNETTTSVDHWGYWNNKPEYSNPLIPGYKINPTTGEYVITGDSREPTTISFERTLLSKMTYPTGGYTEFVYEPHYYSKKLNRTPNSNFFVEMNTENGIVGGARIAKIIDSDGTTTSQTEYKYTSNYPLGTTSSGIQSKVIRYSNFLMSGSNTQYTMLQKSQSNNIVPNTMSGSPITYSEVSVLKNGLLQKKYLFSDYITNPDTLVYRSRQFNNISPTLPQNISNMKISYMDRNVLRGKVLQELYFNDTGANIMKKEYKYLDNKKLPISKYNTIYVGTGEDNVLYYKDFFLPNNLTKVTTVNNFNAQSVNNVTEYFYDHTYDNNLSGEAKSLNGSGTLETSYQYAYEKGNQYLKDSNLIGIPLQTTITKTDNGISKMISNIITNYPISQPDAGSNTSGLAMPKSTQSFDLQNPTLAKTDFFYDKYDDKGNLLQYTMKEGIPVTVIWGYNQTLPIVKIEGIAYDKLMSEFYGWSNDPDTHNAPSYVNLSNLDINSVTEQNLINALDSFRNNPYLKNYFVTTYTYDPLIGITSITPPSGIREVYIYDTANRLKEIKQLDKDAAGNTVYKIVKEYKYNHKN